MPSFKTKVAEGSGKSAFAAFHAEKTRAYYNDPAIAANYGAEEYITDCERQLFSIYVKPGMAILDIGVGGGRTSELLATGASRYVGIDYAPGMIRICQKKYPQWEYLESSATDLSLFQDGGFDLVVMSFNMLDDMIPDENRWRCLRECHRVLRSGGLLIFSSHNPRAIIVRHNWKTAPGDAAAEKWSRTSIIRRLSNFARELSSAIRASLDRSRSYALKAPFFKGEGYMLDTCHLMTHFWVPRAVIRELSQLGFRFITMQGDDYPLKSHSLVTEWYYYVFSKNPAYR